MGGLKRTRHRLRFWIGLIILLMALWGLGRTIDVQAALKGLLEPIRKTGTWAPFWFILVYALATVLLLPGSVLALGAGVLFGVFLGSFLVSIAATLGAAAAFLIARYLARDRVEQRIQAKPKLQAVDQAVAREGWKVVLLARLPPFFPYGFLNYAFGLTRVPLGRYVLASWAGILPGTIMYVYAGALIGNLALIGAGSRSWSPGEWLLYGFGLAATIGVTIQVTRLARRILADTVRPSSPSAGQTPGS